MVDKSRKLRYNYIMKININVEIDTKEDRDELEELIEQLQNLREVMNANNYDYYSEAADDQ